MAAQSDFVGFLEHIRSVAETARVGATPDVEAVRNLVGAMGQSFTTTIFAFQQVSQLKSNMDFLAALAQKHSDGWVAVLAGELFRRPINTLRTRYALQETADLYAQAANLAGSLTNEQLVDLARRMIEHHGFLARRIRDMLPFYELACTFEGCKVMDEAERKAGRG